ncbi:MAG: AAC(3) family N-acetyltransferase [Erysipelotrichaceae bacterium]|nr:AAC(3) family N-acetyltransferase [Erysipelotrichaceae bacterium]
METVKDIITEQQIIEGLLNLGLFPGMILEVHSSLSSFGYVLGGAQAVVNALMKTVGKEGTIVMPMQTTDNTEPSEWVNPPVEPEMCQLIREAMPAFDRRGSDTRGMGKIVENFRRRDGVVISAHPAYSYGAWGKHAKAICNRHSLHFGLSSESPTSRLYELQGYVLLLGVDYDSCTCMHLAEYLTECRPIKVMGSSLYADGKKVWKKYLDLDTNCDDFLMVGQKMEEAGKVKKIKIGNCTATLFKVTDAVDHAAHYLEGTCVYDLYR